MRSGLSCSRRLGALGAVPTASAGPHGLRLAQHAHGHDRSGSGGLLGGERDDCLGQRLTASDGVVMRTTDRGATWQRRQPVRRRRPAVPRHRGVRRESRRRDVDRRTTRATSASTSRRTAARAGRDAPRTRSRRRLLRLHDVLRHTAGASCSPIRLTASISACSRRTTAACTGTSPGCRCPPRCRVSAAFAASGECITSHGAPRVVRHERAGPRLPLRRSRRDLDGRADAGDERLRLDRHLRPGVPRPAARARGRRRLPARRPRPTTSRARATAASLVAARGAPAGVPLGRDVGRTGTLRSRSARPAATSAPTRARRGSASTTAASTPSPARTRTPAGPQVRPAVSRT